jgi:hypothetical protein
MKKGALLAVAAVLFLLSALSAVAFTPVVTPGTIRVDVQAGGYVSQPIEISADEPFVVLASAPKTLAGILRLTRHNDTTLMLHVLPPVGDGDYTAEGTLYLEVQGTQPLTTASAQRVTVPVNITIRVHGKAVVPASVAFSEEEIEILPLSSEGATLLAVVIIGVIALNIVLRQRVKRK